MRILLTSVFGPFAVDDRFGRRENRMELFHNQVTREQGLFSLRFHHHSFGLYFLAENIETPARVLDFPTEKQFVRELRNDYDMVGISFIVPNFEKARHMARLVRRHAPGTRILLGGHGTSVPGVEQRIEHDHICRGEGVRWLRRLLGEDPDRPFRHPVMPAGFQKRVVGVPLSNASAVLVPGVGCPNACRFCATSHFFEKKYTPYFDTGRELFDLCLAAEREAGFTEFFVMDENFLKRPQRARELLSLMEKHRKPYRFSIFSSAETVRDLGPEFLARLGVQFLWMGVESRRETFEKNRGIDAKAMIRELRQWGISTLASGILFLEHHDPGTVWDDIRFLVDLESDFVQFMQLGPLPGTRLFEEYERQGRIEQDVPLEEWHGQGRIWFRHPHFSPEDSTRILREAFQYDYDTRGSWMVRRAETLALGMERISRASDPFLAGRARQIRRDAAQLRQAFPVMRRYAHNETARALADAAAGRFASVFGPATWAQKAAGLAALAFAAREKRRVDADATASQPRMKRTPYRLGARDLVAGTLRGRTLTSLLHVEIQWDQDPVLLDLRGTLDKVNAGKLARRLRTFLRAEKENVSLTLDRLAQADEKSLRRLLGGARRFRKRIFVRFAQGLESVRAVVEGLPNERVRA